MTTRCANVANNLTALAILVIASLLLRFHWGPKATRRTASANTRAAAAALALAQL